MTTLAWVFLAAAGATAASNWWSRARDDIRLEYVTKPATMVLLTAVALALDPAVEGRRWWFVAAALLSLAGDVFLMLPSDRFVAALTSFLLAHLSSYLCVIGTMAALAWASGNALAAAGASCFVASDYLIARTRFVHPRPWAPVAIKALYHVGQAGLLTSLTR